MFSLWIINVLKINYFVDNEENVVDEDDGNEMLDQPENLLKRQGDGMAFVCIFTLTVIWYLFDFFKLYHSLFLFALVEQDREENIK